MEVDFPLFERNRVLKKEMLESMRDYAFVSQQLAYQAYGEGILQGCEVRVEGKNLVIGSGMIKYGNFICFRMEEERVAYLPSEQVQIVKIRFHKKQMEDRIQYQMDLVSDCHFKLEENELELCRYKLQTGAKLRDQYKSFEDMGTEYDMINLISASWGGLHGRTLSPVITRRFAEELLQSKDCGQEDISFAYLCLSQTEAVPRTILLDYIRRKNSGWFDQTLSNQEIFQEMCRILRKTSRSMERNQTERRRILVD